MKVLFLPYWNASENPYQSNLARALEHRGVQVLNLHEHSSRPSRRLPLLSGIWAYGKPDILHLHWSHPYTVTNSLWRSLIRGNRFLFELALLRMLGVCVVWTVHNLLHHERHHPAIERFFTRRLARAAKGVVVHCEAAKDLTLDAYKLPHRNADKMHVVPHASYIGDYPNEVSRSQAREALDLDEANRVFLFLGTLRPYKGVERLVQVFRGLDAPHALLIVAGKPMNDDVLRALEARRKNDSRIRIYPGFVPDGEIQTYMNAADVVVLPFTDVLTSGSALLAMSFAKPIIAPRVGCIPEIVGCDGGFLYRADCETGLADSLTAAIAIPGSRLGEMGTRNFKAVQPLNWDAVAERTFGVYKAAVGANGAAG